MYIRTTLKATLLAAGSALLLGSPAGFAEDSPSATSAKFSTAAEVSNFTVDYSPIAKFSNAFGDTQRGRTKIAYAAVEQQGKTFMASYMAYLSNVPVSQLSQADQRAFWLNTHNMMVVDAMVGSRLRRNMKSARGTYDAPGKMWTEKRITVEGVELSIQDVEKDIILANFSDNPNVIFGLYQGTSGSPGFPKDGFTAANLDAELEAAGRDYLGSRNGVKIRRSKAQIPAIVDWYSAEVFGGDEAAARTHLATLLDSDDAAKFSAATQFETRTFKYSSDEYIIRQQPNLPSGGAGGFGGGGGGGGGS